ncbi:MAG TPA: jacalin-like lectin [Ohtaekwangia sp.]|uniref:jacalin-like lectin n=1 Tax=Ohtaekwangia sp. TaxID=2066019 RepID=UPI002F91CDB5
MKKTKMFLLVLLASLAGCDHEAVNPQASTSPSTSSELSVTSSARAASTGTFSVLTYNVAGLPEGLSSSHPEANTSEIGQRIRNYDIVHVQEDFNYHATLYANDNHAYRTPTSGGVPFGDGLNTLSKFPYTDFQRIKWNNCNGTDCLTPKGFTYSRIRINEGIYIDFYNAHPNAGTEAADLSARHANITQLSQFIAQNSVGNAVIVMGDLNCRYTRAEDNVRELITNNGLTDAWIQLIRQGNIPAAGSNPILCEFPNMANPCEVVDKIFYRDSKFIDFTPTYYQLDNPDFVTDDNQPLSDHYPLLTNFSWSINNGFALSDLFGGPHGTPFNDLVTLNTSSIASKFILRGGSRVDNVGVLLNNGTTLTHGGSGGTEKTLTLNTGEYVQSVKLCSGQKDGHTRVFYIELRTNQGRTLSTGSQTSSTVTYTAPTGMKVTGFYGNSGDEVDQLGIIYTNL